MIKLIASDLDGTLLLNGAQSVSNRAIDLIKQLSQKGILFVAASGRQYPNLYRLFGENSKDMGFICENGALTMYQDKVICKEAMERNLAMSIIHDIDNRTGCEVLISGQDTSFIRPKQEAFLHRMRDVVKNNVTVIENFDDIKEDIIKVSAYEVDGIEHSSDYFTNKWESKLKCTVSGHQWIDFVNPDVNKGSSLKKLMKTLNVSHDEVLAFGDNYNDLEMLSLARYGFVMNNAVEDIKKRYHYHTSSVEDILEELYHNPSYLQ